MDGRESDRRGTDALMRALKARDLGGIALDEALGVELTTQAQIALYRRVGMEGLERIYDRDGHSPEVRKDLVYGAGHVLPDVRNEGTVPIAISEEVGAGLLDLDPDEASELISRTEREIALYLRVGMEGLERIYDQERAIDRYAA